ncbi:MAG: amino acid permease [Desulfobacterales bacterium]|nr:amino acid permease [Desulfobacterales bacterium]
MQNNSGQSQASGTEQDQHKLGMFAGVFTPSILTILGIILFLRMGFTVGNAGFGKAVILISLATLVSVLTTASLSAIATNIQVKGGGAYYLISRTLGVQFGGAIGLILFLAQSVSIAFYCIGFGEAVHHLFPGWPYGNSQVIAGAAILFLFLMAWLGADWATRFQYIVMALLVLALGSFFIGGVTAWQMPVFTANFASPENGLPFWVLFAIFFPAVTGFTQGVNMSGDLKDPGRAIPLGTFLAVGLSTLVYFLAAVVFSGAMTNRDLMSGYDAMKQIALVPGLIDAGVIAATLSSAMASFLGAPRILQSISRDRIFNFLVPFGKGAGVTDNPRRGVLLSCAIALATVGLGQLNLVARVVSMFFLISYGLINYATYYESRAASPSFRPRFKWFHPWVSLAGFLTCAGSVLAIDIKSGIMAVCILMAIYQYLRRNARPARWADSRRASFLQRAKNNLHAAAKEPHHDRDWRPVILAFTNNPGRMRFLLGFAAFLEGRSGMTAAVRLIRGQGLRIRSEREDRQRELAARVRDIHDTAFPMVLSVPDIPDSLPGIIHAFGLGPITANTALVNWMDEMNKGLEGAGSFQYARSLRIGHREGLNIILLHADENRWTRIIEQQPKDRTIDVWWRNDANSRLMLMLAYLMTRHSFWSGAKIRILTPAADGENSVSEDSVADFKAMMARSRIDADHAAVPDDAPDTVIEFSSSASCVFLPFRIRDNHVMDSNQGVLPRLLPYLPVTAMVMAAQGIDLEADPETGTQGKLARAEDRMNRDKERYAAARKEETLSREKAETLTEDLLKLSPEDEDLAKSIRTADQAIEDADRAFKKAAKARARYDESVKTYEQIANGRTGPEAPRE